MTYILIFLVVVIGLFIWFRAGSKKKLMCDLQRAVDMVKVGMYERLLVEYEERYESEFAGLLAATCPPTNRQAASGPIRAAATATRASVQGLRLAPVRGDATRVARV
jgi:hypothetical protein